MKKHHRWSTMPVFFLTRGGWVRLHVGWYRFAGVGDGARAAAAAAIRLLFEFFVEDSCHVEGGSGNDHHYDCGLHGVPPFGYQ